MSLRQTLLAAARNRSAEASLFKLQGGHNEAWLVSGAAYRDAVKKFISTWQATTP